MEGGQAEITTALNKPARTSKRKVGIVNWVSDAEQSILPDFRSRFPKLNNMEEGETSVMPPTAGTASDHEADIRSIHSRRATVHYSSSGRPSFMGSKR